MIKKLRNQILWILELIKLSILEMLSFRTSFIMQVFGMAVNNTGFIAIWYIFFQIFKDVNGWNFKEMLGLNGVIASIYGLVFSVGAGTRKISKMITFGELDKYLTQPKNVLINVVFSESHISAIGDILSGTIFLSIYLYLTDLSLQLLLIIPIMIILGTFIFSGFIITVQSIAFWIPNSEELSATLFEFLLGPSLYPNKSFTGTIRIFFTFFVPAIFLAGEPIDILLTGNISRLMLMFTVAICWLAFSAFVFYRGLKRYESGNLVG